MEDSRFYLLTPIVVYAVKYGAQYEPAGHIGAFLWDQVTAVGCAVTDCTHTPTRNWLSACQ
jgi:hypothetical protein